MTSDAAPTSRRRALARRALAAVAAAAAASVLLSGCAAGATASHPDAAVAQLRQLGEAVGKHVGSRWHEDDSYTPGNGYEGGECKRSNGDRGVDFAIAWSGAGVADPGGAARRIQAEWRTLGFHAHIEDGSYLPNLTGTNRVVADPQPDHKHDTTAYPDGSYVELIIGTDSTVMAAATRCLRDDRSSSSRWRPQAWQPAARPRPWS